MTRRLLVTYLSLAIVVLAALEIPLGVLTAFIGAPFFIWLLAATRRGWA